MDNRADQYEKQPNIAHVDGAPLGSERPPFAIPGHAPQPPMVMPVETVRANLTKGAMAGTLDASLAGLTGTTKGLVTHRDGQPIDREGVGADPLVPGREVAAPKLGV